MDEQRAAEIQTRLLSRLPDCRISTAFDIARSAQRFQVRHGRIVTHFLYIEKSAVDRFSQDELLRLVETVIVDRLRLTSSRAEVRVNAAGVQLRYG
jgi:hypothetical protein